MSARDEMKKRLEQKSSDELLGILQRNDRSEWTQDAFSVMRDILTDRGVTVQTDPNQQPRTYRVGFHSLFGSDQFGFRHAGTIRYDSGLVTLSGKKEWPFPAQLGVFLVATIGLYFLIGLGFGFLTGALLVYTVCVSPFQITVPVRDITNVARRSRKLFLTVKTGDRAAKTTRFTASSEEEANGLEILLRSPPAPPPLP